jgi:molecular chaperone GrpE
MEKEKSSFAKTSASAPRDLTDKPEGGAELNIRELKKQLAECQKQKDEYLAGWQRARADFLNYKKEEMERIETILKYAGEELILKILPILDNFYLAEEKLPQDLKKEDNVKGVLQIKNQIEDFLKNQGVEEIKTVGEKFDPNFQEAVGETEEKDAEPGTVIEEVQKGYKMNGRLLRPAKVKISK